MGERGGDRAGGRLRREQRAQCRRRRAGAYRGAQSGAQCLYRDRRRARAGEGAPNRRRARQSETAARRRALCSQESVRYRRACHRRRLQDQPRAFARDARFPVDRKVGSSRRRLGRCAQHGRICLRLHRRERARRPFAQSARRKPHDRRLVRRLGRRGRRRPGAARARLRHQRLYSRAVLAVRDFRPEADLWKAQPRALVSLRRQPRSSRAVRALDARPRARLRRHARVRCRRCRLRRSAARAGNA